MYDSASSHAAPSASFDRRRSRQSSVLTSDLSVISVDFSPAFDGDLGELLRSGQWSGIFLGHQARASSSVFPGSLYEYNLCT